MAAGVVAIFASIVHPELSDETFNDWYSNIHVHEAYNAGMTDLALRYKNTDPNASWKYLALYKTQDLARMQDKERLAKVAPSHEMLPGVEPGSKGGKWTDVTKSDAWIGVSPKGFEGRNQKEATPEGVILVRFDAREVSAEEVDAFCKAKVLHPEIIHRNTDFLQHSELSSIPEYERTTTYKMMDGSGFMAIHEFETAKIPRNASDVTTSTSVDSREAAGIDNVTFSSWELISQYGTGKL